MGHKKFQYWIYLLHKILHLGENDKAADIKELLIYKLNK